MKNLSFAIWFKKQKFKLSQIYAQIRKHQLNILIFRRSQPIPVMIKDCVQVMFINTKDLSLPFH